MNGDAIVAEINEVLASIEKDQGTAADVEKIREIIASWDEYADWGDDR